MQLEMDNSTEQVSLQNTENTTPVQLPDRKKIKVKIEKQPFSSTLPAETQGTEGTGLNYSSLFEDQ
jgi:hypothetical protein